MSAWVPCPTCAGSGQVEKPSITEKVARHLIYAAAHAEQKFGLGFTPEEVEELGVELGLLPRPGPDPAEALAPELPTPAPSSPIAATPPAAPLPIEAAAAAAVAHPAEPEAADAAADDGYDEDAPPPYFPPSPDRPNGVPEGPAADLPGGVKIEPLDQPWRPVSGQQIATPGIPKPAGPGGPGAAGASLTGPPGGN